MDFDFAQVVTEEVTKWLNNNRCKNPHQVFIDIVPSEITVRYSVQSLPFARDEWDREGQRTFNAVPERDMVKTVAAVIGQAIKQEVEQ